MERERNVQRIDGIRTHLHLLSMDELNTERGYAVDRMHAAAHDIEVLEGELATRRELGEIMLVPQLEVTPVVQQDFETHMRQE